MLREDSVNYSSLPQDEGTTPNSSFITTRSAPSHNQRDCKIATILTIGIIVAGIGLAATIPFIVRGLPNRNVSGNGPPSNIEENNDILSSHLNVGDGNNAVVDDIQLNKSDQGQPGAAVATERTKLPVPLTPSPVPDEKTNEKQPMQPHPVLVTFEPQVPVTTQRSFSSSDGSDERKEADLGSAINESSPLLGVDDEVPDKVDAGDEGYDSWEDYKDGGDIGDKVGAGPKEEVKPVIASGGNDEGSVTSHPDESAKLPDTNGSVGSAKYKVTLITLASVVAVAVAGVMAAIGILIYSRIASRRRRINIQNVITDLQSRDKVVLLNSESEEE
ncbi:uncharacterized protein [Palaemon carinicauda]|uniref:uncharacterized protein isoform X2 n=1 Tax=Palaemon carinicauda TaxID=392227 RepID=UPI0035B5E39D